MVASRMAPHNAATIRRAKGPLSGDRSSSLMRKRRSNLLNLNFSPPLFSLYHLLRSIVWSPPWLVAMAGCHTKSSVIVVIIYNNLIYRHPIIRTRGRWLGLVAQVHVILQIVVVVGNALFAKIQIRQ